MLKLKTHSGFHDLFLNYMFVRSFFFEEEGGQILNMEPYGEIYIYIYIYLIRLQRNFNPD